MHEWALESGELIRLPYGCFPNSSGLLETHKERIMKRICYAGVWLAAAGACLAKEVLVDGRPVAQTEPLSPEGTVKALELPEGFRANLVAGEPDLVQPIAFTMDDRGRLWVLENRNYPVSPGVANDRIMILEDADGDGVAEKQTVFHDKLTFASAIAVGYGGVWVGAPPNLLFFPRKEDEDVFKGEPKVVLDGWGAQDTHETLNNFIWGPDGWLYGSHGVFTHSKVGKPGTPDQERIRINAGIFRVHPKTHGFELYAEGGSNQWGLDFDDRGQGYFAACVISHMWQAIQGARYTRQAGSHFDPHSYEDIKTIADFSYEKRAYCGAMVYLGGQWPEKYRDTFFFGDIHMNKLRNERFERKGSGMKAVKNGDFLFSEDPWYRGLSQQYGPDGSVFISDWYDKMPCYQQRAHTDRTNGRIYRITYREPVPVKVDLQKASNAELVEYQLHANDWFVRHARRVLVERGPNAEVHAGLKKLLEHAEEPRRLRALWALHVTEGLDEALLMSLLEKGSEYVRAWAVQLAAEDGKVTEGMLAKFVALAEKDDSALIRRYLASAAGRLENRKVLLMALASRAEDAEDQNIPQLLWYAAEPVIAGENGNAAAQDLLEASVIPMLDRNIGRRIAAKGDTAALAALLETLGKTSSGDKAAEILAGMNRALQGKKDLEAPENWGGLYVKFSGSKNRKLREQAKIFAASFGGEEAIAEMRAVISSPDADVEKKKQALEALLKLGDPALHGTLTGLIRTPNPLRETALRGLAVFPLEENSGLILAAYEGFSTSEKTAALATLASRKAGVEALLKAVEEGKVPQGDLSAPLVRQMQGLGDAGIDTWIAKNWGSMKQSTAQKQKEMTRFKVFLGDDAILKANAGKGRAIYNQRCAACHVLHGEGVNIGPELPGNFKDVDYLLENILDPNSTIGIDYQQTTVEKKDGQFVTGVIVSERDDAVTLKTLAGDVAVARGEIAKQTTSEQSLMPEGLLNGLEEQDIRDLFLYLRQPEQVPLAE